MIIIYVYFLNKQIVVLINKLCLTLNIQSIIIHNLVTYVIFILIIIIYNSNFENLNKFYSVYYVIYVVKLVLHYIAFRYFKLFIHSLVL